MICKLVVKALCVSALFWGCASDRQNAGSQKNTPPGGSSTGAGPVANNPPDRSKRMTGVAAAFEAFRAHAAQRLGVPADQIEGGPRTEADVGLVPQRVGSVWAFIMRKSGVYDHEVRGWATGDGTVVTLEQNLGVLLDEAGVWGRGVTPPLTAVQIAERLTWSLGMSYAVFMLPHLGVPAPELVMKDGAGKLTFVVDYQQPGPRGPRQLTRFEIALTADRRATATQARIPSP
ncbi:MAG TPA: hypothetical protein VK932_19900 [Kofleriaceae bacterium]|nr:hypothetical protein [Kofleriaceae bacterium]